MRSDSSQEEDAKKKSEYYSLLLFLAFTAVGSAILSAQVPDITVYQTVSAIFISDLQVQMCITGSKANATSAVIEFSFLRTTYFITRSVYVHLYFPENHFGLLYGKSILSEKKGN